MVKCGLVCTERQELGLITLTTYLETKEAKSQVTFICHEVECLLQHKALFVL